MPYEDDYKMWLEKMLIEMNPDWICDRMNDTEFTQDWCCRYCGKDDCYITPKCLHMFYQHIARADRKTENSSEKPNNCEPQTKRAETMSCQECKHYRGVVSCRPYIVGLECKYEPKNEPQTDCAWK